MPSSISGLKLPIVSRCCVRINGTFLIRRGNREQLYQDFVGPEDILQFGETSIGVADLLAAIERKHKDVKTSQLHRAGPMPPKSRADEFRGARLVRCVCGEVKKEGETCPS